MTMTRATVGTAVPQFCANVACRALLNEVRYWCPCRRFADGPICADCFAIFHGSAVDR